MTPISPIKTLPLALLMTTLPASALVTVPFTSYGEPSCSGVPVGSARLVSTYCVNIEDFPIRSFSAYISEGSCKADQTAVLRLFGEAGCEGVGVLEEVKLGVGVGGDGDERACFGLEGTVRSLEVVCV